MTPDLRRAGRGAVAAARMLVGRHQPVRIVVLTPGRAGSVLLLSLLSSLPWVHADPGLLLERPDEPADLIDRRARRAAARRATAWATSIHPEFLIARGVGDPVAWMADRHQEGIRIVTLTRQNLVEAAMSAVVSKARGTWHRTGDAREQTVKVDPFDVLRATVDLERSTYEVHAMVAELSHLHLVYELALRDPANQQDTVDRVLRFAGVESGPVATPLVKRSAPFAEQVENFDEVARVLAETRYGHFVDGLPDDAPPG